MSKVDLESNPFKSKIKSIKLIHPHAPNKMLSSIGFGDGKVRHRHHSRQHESIRVGEISLDEDLKQKDQIIPINKRIKKFGREDLPKKQRFEYNLADYDQNNDIQEEVE